MGQTTFLTPATIPNPSYPTVTGGLVTGPLPSANPPTVNNQTTTSPQTIVNQAFPEKIIAHDTVASTINTQSSQILGTFTLGTLGGIQIGKYTNGVSGQIAITPNGITATNVNGANTFTLDGATGSATFLGTLQAGTLVAGDSGVIIDGSSSAGRIVVFSAGIPAILIGNI